MRNDGEREIRRCGRWHAVGAGGGDVAPTAVGVLTVFGAHTGKAIRVKCVGRRRVGVRGRGRNEHLKVGEVGIGGPLGLEHVGGGTGHRFPIEVDRTGGQGFRSQARGNGERRQFALVNLEHMRRRDRLAKVVEIVGGGEVERERFHFSTGRGGKNQRGQPGAGIGVTGVGERKRVHGRGSAGERGGQRGLGAGLRGFVERDAPMQGDRRGGSDGVVANAVVGRQILGAGFGQGDRSEPGYGRAVGVDHRRGGQCDDGAAIARHIQAREHRSHGTGGGRVLNREYASVTGFALCGEIDEERRTGGG